MNKLEKYVDHLFTGYKKTLQVQELRNEILSNLEAKVHDLTAHGMKYEVAVQEAKSSIKSVDGLVEGHFPYYVNKYKAELLQTAALYFLIAWVLTIPLSLIEQAGILLSVILPILAAVCYISYLKKTNLNQNNKDIAISHDVSNKRHRNIAWAIWTVFFLIQSLFTTAIHFGSDIWFGRSIQILGPYQFAVLATHYIWPLITVIIPLLFQASLKVKQKHMVGESL
ncbi:hypothetical protein [Paenibacillus xylanilyticus]|uniref:Uncharacterized protein n=1 Tax=Paenibacillus xylanilyticus TaxID=248903 RepID=A0A7Y6EYL0_9BACL|nr:hypothetical protein [Paenibacillus xylanilyticus]NUU78968.1 hypothetical protein [Paenibacillus xylanilyticus]